MARSLREIMSQPKVPRTRPSISRNLTAYRRTKRSLSRRSEKMPLNTLTACHFSSHIWLRCGTLQVYPLFITAFISHIQSFSTPIYQHRSHCNQFQLRRHMSNCDCLHYILTRPGQWHARLPSKPLPPHGIARSCGRCYSGGFGTAPDGLIRHNSDTKYI